jgi:hypothetical protein
MRKIVAILLGAVAGTAILFLVGMIANSLHPTPPVMMGPATPEAVALRAAFPDTRTWLVVTFGLAFGGFIDGVIGVSVANKKTVWVTDGIGVLLSASLFPYLGGLAVLRLT